MEKVTIKKILKKKGKVPITCLAAYSKTLAKIIDKYFIYYIDYYNLFIIFSIKPLIARAFSIALGKKKQSTFTTEF